jgi:hypothetical protein
MIVKIIIVSTRQPEALPRLPPGAHARLVPTQARYARSAAAGIITKRVAAPQKCRSTVTAAGLPFAGQFLSQLGPRIGATSHAVPTLVIIMAWLIRGQPPDGSPPPRSPLPRWGRPRLRNPHSDQHARTMINQCQVP